MRKKKENFQGGGWLNKKDVTILDIRKKILIDSSLSYITFRSALERIHYPRAFVVFQLIENDSSQEKKVNTTFLFNF